MKRSHNLLRQINFLPGSSISLFALTTAEGSKPYSNALDDFDLFSSIKGGRNVPAIGINKNIKFLHMFKLVTLWLQFNSSPSVASIVFTKSLKTEKLVKMMHHHHHPYQYYHEYK